MWVQQLQEASSRLLNCILVATSHSPEVHTRPNMGLKVPSSEFPEDLSQVIGHESIPERIVVRTDFGQLPARQIRMDTVQKCRILQLWRENCKEVFVTGCWLPPFNVRVDVAS